MPTALTAACPSASSRRRRLLSHSIPSVAPTRRPHARPLSPTNARKTHRVHARDGRHRHIWGGTHRRATSPSSAARCVALPSRLSSLKTASKRGVDLDIEVGRWVTIRRLGAASAREGDGWPRRGRRRTRTRRTRAGGRLGRMLLWAATEVVDGGGKSGGCGGGRSAGGHARERAVDHLPNILSTVLTESKGPRRAGVS